MSDTTATEELFLPEPLPREVKYTVISVDDHVVEPPHTFEGRLPAHLQDRAPRVADTPQGLQIWEFEDQKFTQVGMNAVAGRRPSQKMEPCRFDEMRPSCYDADARVRDMDINGIWAAVNFPSMVTGFCGRVLFNAQDRELGQACIRAWNDWLYEEWYVPHPTRIIPLGIAALSDPDAAVAEIHRNAERGFTAITMPERPHLIGLPDLWQRDHWDPIIQACVDTETVLSIHVGSSGGAESPASAPRLQLGATLFGQLSLHACAEWLWSEYPVKHPDLKLAMSEGGIGWVAMLIDRLDNIIDRSGYGAGWDTRPSDVLRRNFWFCTIDDPSTIDTRHTIGVENIMVETDFPHGDGTWPDTQLVIEKLWGHIPDDELRMMCSTNAAKLYRHPLPDVVLPEQFRTRRRPVCDASRRMTTTTDAPDAPDAVAKPSRMAAWRAHSFGPASEQPYRRRTSDWVRLVLGIAILVFAIWHQDSPGDFERNLFTTLNGLPSDLDTFFRLLYALGALWALALVVVAAVVARRWRLARDLAIGGVATWVLARLIGTLVVENASLTHALDVVTRIGDDTVAFPAVRVGVIVAVISVASPYLTRPVRRIGQLLVLLIAVASLYLGTTLPDGVLAAVALGWSVAALVHLAFGSPGGRPTSAQVQATLVELGVDAHDVHLLPQQPTTGTAMSARDDTGDLMVRVLGRDEADAQLMSKFWRSLAYKDGGPALHTTRLEDVEAQAYALLLAERAGVQVPAVVVAGTAGPGAALIASRPRSGTPLCDLDASSVTDAVLVDLWKQVAAMHDARVAHGRLNCNHVVVDGTTVGIGDFEFASGAAASGRRDADVAELLVSTALLVGDDRAIAAARTGLGDAAIVEALPYLQPAALSRDLRPERRHRKERSKQVASVRAAAAAATGTEEPPLQELHRVSGTNLMMAVGTLIAVFALLSQVGSPQELWDTITNAELGWLIVAMIISLLTNFATAVALMGTVPINLPLMRTAELQLSMSFSNLAVPAIGGMAAQIRFLQKQGVDLASAVASGGLLINVGNIVAQVMLLGVALLLAPARINVEPVDTQKLVTLILVVIVIAVIVIGVVLGIPKLRNYVVPPTKAAAATLWAAVRSPRRVALLLGGNAINALMYAGVYMACIYAFGGSINFWTLLSLNIIISTLASLVPIPGGNTAVSSVGMSGALAAVGVPTDIAVAAVLADQLVSSFLPAVPGWWATNDLLHDDYL